MLPTLRKPTHARNHNRFRPALESCEPRNLTSLFVASPVMAPSSGALVWTRVPDPAHPGAFLPSYYKGGVLLAIEAHGRGTETAKWVATGLTQGYYSVSVYYQSNASNATDATVSYKTSANSNFVTLATKLNETTGTPDTTGTKPVDGWLPVHTLVTPYKTSNAASYIWVPQGSSVAIMLSDAGCSSGRIIADTIMLTLISTTK